MLVIFSTTSSIRTKNLILPIKVRNNHYTKNSCKTQYWFLDGIKAVAGLKLGNDPKTLMSVGATSASITTKGILYSYLNHNVFTNALK